MRDASPSPAVAPPSVPPRRRSRVPCAPEQTSQGCLRQSLGRRFVYLLISPRARGLSVGVNLNPDQACNFDCVYCEVDRTTPARSPTLEVPVMTAELEATLRLIAGGGLKEQPAFAHLPPPLLALKHVTLSGDGEPTLCPVFCEAVEAITHLRARARVPFFRLVLITNATGLDRPAVQEGLRLLAPCDEIWAKLDVGTQAAMDAINRSQVPLTHVLANILATARQRPVIIQSLFTAVEGRRLPEAEVMALAERLRELKDAGANLPLVQVYSANRPAPNARCRHLDLRELSAIARLINRLSGVPTEVF